MNCQHPVDGNPCNACPACLGIENGSILDVLELDAASNNGVDQVRALRDEAVYTPAAVRKRVYIVDEVHMLSTPAFNALLKILEEPPAHLMFILATTELHKVPATIKSRCQQFAFKRILPGQIAQRLEHVAGQESIPLTKEGAALLARLADGGMRDALSLLDQCAGGGRTVDEEAILDILGLAGNLRTAALMEQIAQRDTAGALDTLAQLYAGGKDVGSVLSELSALARDLLLRKTAPQGGASLLTGGYDETTMRRLGELLPAQRLLQILTLLQDTAAALPRSANRRTDTELCLLRLCDERLDDSFLGLSARLAALEQRVANGVPAAPAAAPTPAPAPEKKPAPAPKAPAPADDLPPWEEERPPLPEEPPEERDYGLDIPAPAPAERPAPDAPRTPAPQGAAAPVSAGDSAFWPGFAAGLRGKVPPSINPYLNNPAKVTGVWGNGALTLWVDSEFTRSMLNKPAIVAALTQAAQAAFGGQPRVSIVAGKPPAAAQAPASPAPQPSAPEEEPLGKLDDLIAFGQQFDNITIK